NMSVLRIAEIYREAIARNCPSIILAHNHPSGDPTPSPEDIELTRTLATAGRLLDITLVDHLIIGQQQWVSLREQGFLT
ncbi:MAG: JAB domain-containing protein, partial [Chloroflexota bacterium]